MRYASCGSSQIALFPAFFYCGNISCELAFTEKTHEGELDGAYKCPHCKELNVPKMLEGDLFTQAGLLPDDVSFLEENLGLVKTSHTTVTVTDDVVYSKKPMNTPNWLKLSLIGGAGFLVTLFTWNAFQVNHARQLMPTQQVTIPAGTVYEGQPLQQPVVIQPQQSFGWSDYFMLQAITGGGNYSPAPK